MNKKGSETTQTQNVSQSTTVSLTNVIDNTRPLEALEKVKMMAEIFNTIDQQEIARKNAGIPQSVVSVTNVPAAAYLSNPLTLGMIVGGVLLSIYLFKKRGR